MRTPEITPPDDARRRRTLRLVIVLAVSGVVAIGALVIALVLNQPSGSKPATSATITVGPIVPAGQQLTGAASALPPISIVLNRTDAISNMAANDQIIALRGEIISHPTSNLYLNLGQAYMSIGDQTSALSAFSHAARLAPGTAEPLVGLAMTLGMGGTSGLNAAATALAALATRFPNNQVVQFNDGWVAVYRRDVPTITSAWKRAVALGPTTALGSAATTLLHQIGMK